MGITGLLPFLEKSSRKTNIGEFAGKTVAIDSYCWLHKGIFCCAEKIILGEPTDAHVQYCMKFINMLLRYNIKPILVFDGRRLPAKAVTEAKRRENRRMKRQKAAELIKMGQISEGKNLLRQSIDVTHEIALEFIKACQSLNIDCIVAPYEADAELAYLNINGIADVVITEDSDLILFGCKKIFFKMDVYGEGVLVEQDRLYLAMNMKPDAFHMDMFRYMCILSGCDYLPSLPGIGLNKAKKFVMLSSHCDIRKALANLGTYVKLKSVNVSEEYKDAFIQAHITFKHQLVFCPLRRRQVRLNPPTADVTEEQLHYAGKELNHNIALQIAYGNCDPVTLKILHNFDPDKKQNLGKLTTKNLGKVTQHVSIWSKEYKLQQNISDACEQNEKNEESKLFEQKVVLRPNQLKQIIVRKEDPIEYEELAEKDILETYKSENCQPIEPLEYSERDSSPVRPRKTNVFAKQGCNNEISPSLIYKRKSRIVSKFKKTTIDDTVITESKFFSDKSEYKENRDNASSDDADMFNDSSEYNTPKRMKIEIEENVKVEVESVNTINEVASNFMDIDQKESSLNENDNVLKRNEIEGMNSVDNCKLSSSTVTETDLKAGCEMKSYDIDDRLTLSSLSSESDYAVSQNSIEICDHSFQVLKKQTITSSNAESIQELNAFSSKKEVKRKSTPIRRRSKQLSSERGQQSLLSMFSFQNRH